MLKNYLKTSFRSLVRNKFFSTINIVGLAVSMSICMGVIMLVADQMSYDRYNTKRDRIFRITTKHVNSDGTIENTGTNSASPMPLRQELLENYTGIEQVVRLKRGFGNSWIELENQNVNIPLAGFYADAEVLQFFEYELQYGDANTALKEPYSLVLTRQAANKLFKDENPLGQTISVGDLGTYTVTGVLKETQRKSHIVFEALASMATINDRYVMNDWTNYWEGWTYALLEEKHSADPDHIKAHRENFEKFYSEISKDAKFNSERQYIEEKVYAYFNTLDLPDTPTIYDYLVLALRYRRDVIATFNWDPFLYKAYVRNGQFVKSPGILHLHGCVSLGYNKSNGSAGPAGWYSKATEQRFEPTRLLYPVEKKDYNSDPFVKGQWDALAEELKIAERVTVFGYSAPVTDVEAIELLQKAWGKAEERAMEQFELIDIREESEVRKSWNTFIHSHHYNYCKDYFKSSFAYHPRRTVESYHHWSMPMSPSDSFQDGNPVPADFRSLEELWGWHKPLIEAEEEFYGSSYTKMHQELMKQIK